jgi:Peptidase A4 family
MLPKGLRISAVSFVLAIAPALAQVSSGPAATPDRPVVSPRQHAPRRVYPGRPARLIDNVTVEDSTNWSGYAVEGTSFTKALGSWTVPTVTCSKTPNTYSSFWVGIDGWTSSTVEQTGTDSDCNGSRASYYAWYEFYPNPSIEITSVPVSPGNHISASVTYSGTQFTITLTNETTGRSYSKSSKVSGAKRTSAEWIAEAPCCTRSGGILPLSDFGTVDFGEDYTGISSTNDATDSTVSGAIGAFGSNVFESIMVNGTTGADEAVPSALSSDGSSFTVTWDSE